MRAIVLAAGLGTRLGEITADTPKCMVEIDGVPVLERNVRWLVSHGITDIAINLHHLPDVVTDHLGDGRELGASIRWSYERRLLGTAGTLTSLRPWLAGGPFLVVYGDNLIDIDLGSVVSLHRTERAAATVALFWREDVSASGVAELDGTRIVRFIEKPLPGETGSHWVNAGLLVLEPAGLAHMPRRGDLGLHVLPRLMASGARVVGYRMSSQETLHWIDTPADLERTVSLLSGALA